MTTQSSSTTARPVAIVPDLSSLPSLSSSPANTTTKPRRALSAYNFFFMHHRKKILETADVRPEGKPRQSHGKIGFAALARTIADRWKQASQEEKTEFEEESQRDKLRYKREMIIWEARKAESEMRLLSSTSALPSNSTSPLSEERMSEVLDSSGRQERTARAVVGNTSLAVVSPHRPQFVMTDDTMDDNTTPARRRQDQPIPYLDPLFHTSTSAFKATSSSSSSSSSLRVRFPPLFERYYRKRVDQFCRAERRRLMIIEQRRRMRQNLDATTTTTTSEHGISSDDNVGE